MRQIIKFEFLKLFTSKLFIYAFVIFLTVNIGILFYTESTIKDDGISYSSYKHINNEFKGLNEDEKQRLIENEYEKIYAFNIIQNIRNLKNSQNLGMQEYSESLKSENEELYSKYLPEYEENKLEFKYTGDLRKELVFLEELKLEYNSTKDYKQAIENILEKADNLEELAIFKNSGDNFSNRSIKDIANEYKKMDSVKIDYQVGKGLNSFIKTSITEVLIILLIFVISSIIVFEEKEKNLFPLIKSTKNGRVKTIISKVLVLFISVVTISIVMHSINLIYYAAKIGFGEIGASIQSIKTFMYSTLEINIFEYILLFLGTKILVYFIISLIVLLISIFAKNNVTTYLSCIILFFICFLLYTNVDVASKYNSLKYINLFNLLQVNDIYNTYLNLKMGVFMQDVLTLSMIFESLLLLGLIASILLTFSKKRDLSVKENSILNNIKWFSLFKLKSSGSVFGNECYKLFITNKVIIILLLLTIFQIYNIKSTSQTISFNESIYKNYMEVLKGKLTPEKREFIEKEQLKYRQAEESITKIEEQYTKGEISKLEMIRYKEPYEEILSTREAFSRVEEKYEYIKEYPKAEFVYDTGYKNLLRTGRDVFLENDIYLIVISIICFTGIFVMEYKTGAINILNATPKGREYTAKRKIIVSILASTIIFILIIAQEIIKTFMIYGYSGIMSSITSLSYFNSLPSSLNILQYIVIMYVLKYVIFLSIVMLILWLSLKMKNTTYSILALSSILLIPIMLFLLSLDFARNISIIPMLNSSRTIIQGGLNWLYLILPIILGTIMYHKTCKECK